MHHLASFPTPRSNNPNTQFSKCSQNARDLIEHLSDPELHMMSSFVRAISTVNVRADHTQDQSTANPLTFQIGGKVLKSHGFAIETIFEQDPDDSSGIDELMRILRSALCARR